MNLWDSIHRGLDKASQEAARLAKVQRLRVIIDGLTRHINTQHTMLISKTLELYTSGQLTQSELLPICQALTELQQQMQQAQNELKQIQGNAPTPPPPPLQGAGTAPQSGATMLYSEPGETVAAELYASPTDYQPYVDAGPVTAPPPPPGGEAFAGSEMETVMAPPPPPGIPAMPPAAQGTGMDAPRYCPVCQAELNPSHAFCHNCGTLVQHHLAQMPTMRAGAEIPFAAEGQETLRANIAGTSEQETIRADENLAPPIEENEGV